MGQNVLSINGKLLVAENSLIVPKINLQEKEVTPQNVSQTVSPDEGYTGLSSVTVEAMPTTTQATPSITVSTDGLITASVTQTAGYVAADTKSATKQLTTKTATTITPTTSVQTAVESGVYTTGEIKVAAIPTATRANTTITSTADDTNDKLTFTASNNQSTGYVTGSNKTATKTVTLTASGANVTASDGTNSISKSVATATQVTPSITVSTSGLITASATQTAGYVSAGTKSATKQLTVQAAQTITPGTSNKTIASGRYLTGTQTIQGDANLKAANIKSGVSIFGVSGSYTGVTTAYAVIGVTYPSGSTCTCTNGSVTYTAPDTTGYCAFIIPSNGTWTVKIVSGQQSASKNVSITTKGQVKTTTLTYGLDLYNAGNECTSITGGWDLYAWGVSTAEKQSDCIYLFNNDGQEASATTIKNINMSSYSTLNVKLNDSSRTNYGYFAVEAGTALGEYYPDGGVETFTLDVSAVSSGKIMLRPYGLWSDNANELSQCGVYISRVWLT